MYTLKIMLGFAIFFIANTVFASGDHHNTVNIYLSEQTINNAVARSEVRAAAAGQTNYKATAQIQWNLSSAFSGSESALSIGLGYQAGSIFVAGSVTDNTDTMFTKDSDPLVAISASGVF